MTPDCSTDIEMRIRHAENLSYEGESHADPREGLRSMRRAIDEIAGVCRLLSREQGGSDGWEDLLDQMRRESLDRRAWKAS